MGSIWMSGFSGSAGLLGGVQSTALTGRIRSGLSLVGVCVMISPELSTSWWAKVGKTPTAHAKSAKVKEWRLECAMMTV